MIYLGSDHAGFALKELVKSFLKKKKIPFFDLSPKKVMGDDYPFIGKKVGKKVKKKDFGILFCGSSYGVCIAANKVKGIRAVSPNTIRDVKLCRLHNDANVLCLSGWHTTKKKAERLVEAFLQTPFSNEERHMRRVLELSKK